MKVYCANFFRYLCERFDKKAADTTMQVLRDAMREKDQYSDHAGEYVSSMHDSAHFHGSALVSAAR